MKHLVIIFLAMVLFGCSRSSEEKNYPLDSLINPDLINHDVTDLNNIEIVGNAKGITKIIETKLTDKNGKIYESSNYVLTGEKINDTTTIWNSPISVQLRREGYKKIYELVTRCHELYDNKIFNQFYAIVASEPDRVSIILNGKRNSKSVGGDRSVGVLYDYSSRKIVVRCSKGFIEREVVEALHRLFPEAEFKDQYDKPFNP